MTRLRWLLAPARCRPPRSRRIRRPTCRAGVLRIRRGAHADPANAATLALGSGATVGAQVAQLIGLVCLAWLGVLAYRGVRAYYEVDRPRATRILLIALVLFYIVPLMVIVGAAVSIIVAAVVLGYF